MDRHSPLATLMSTSTAPDASHSRIVPMQVAHPAPASSCPPPPQPPHTAQALSSRSPCRNALQVGLVSVGLVLRGMAPTLIDLEGHEKAAFAALTPQQTIGLACAATAALSYSLLGVLYERTVKMAGEGLSHSKVGGAGAGERVLLYQRWAMHESSARVPCDRNAMFATDRCHNSMWYPACVLQLSAAA